jgi:hypothetical protein
MLEWLFATLHPYREIVIFLALGLGYNFGSFTFGGIGLGSVTAILLAAVIGGQIGIAISTPCHPRRSCGAPRAKNWFRCSQFACRPVPRIVRPGLQQPATPRARLVPIRMSPSACDRLHGEKSLSSHLRGAKLSRWRRIRGPDGALWERST